MPSKPELDSVELYEIASTDDDEARSEHSENASRASEQGMEGEYTPQRDDLDHVKWLHTARRKRYKWPLLALGALLLLGILIGIFSQPQAKKLLTGLTSQSKTDDSQDSVDNQPLASFGDDNEPPGVGDGSSTTATGCNDPGHFAQPGSHPIDDLIKFSECLQKEILSRQTKGVKEAAEAYRKRRGRHPPPGFAEWVQYAENQSALMIEEFFDPIYSDLEPFWAVPTEKIRSDSSKIAEKMIVRNGKLEVKVNHQVFLTWMENWYWMIQPVQKLLPDVDVTFNGQDEPRVLVPWRKVQDNLELAEQTRARGKELRLTNFIQSYQKLPPLPERVTPPYADVQSERNNMSFWHYARETCPPDTGVSRLFLDSDWTTPPPFPDKYPEESYTGFVSNWTHSKWACAHPHLRNLHGAFVAPRNNHISTEFFPFFSGCKILGMNNDIRVPAAKYFDYNEAFSGESEEKEIPWDKKRDAIGWRGSASGGNHDQNNWRRIPRIRFISMMNGTEVALTGQKLARFNGSVDAAYYANPKLPHDFIWPNTSLYPVSAAMKSATDLGDWIGRLSDAAFTHFQCYPSWLTQFTDGHNCSYLNPFFHAVDAIPFHELFNDKYLPDIDGHSYSGRWRALLKSGSLPFKATVYSEWHDSRILPWVHFIPLDNTLADFYSVLEYFAGGPDNRPPARSRMAKRIARQGSVWARSALRSEDMVIYMHRLLLEYARISDDNREIMGYTADLLPD